MQSAHTASVAAACAEQGITAHLLIRGERPAVPIGFHLLARMYGHVKYVTRAEYANRDAMLQKHAKLLKEGAPAEMKVSVTPLQRQVNPEDAPWLQVTNEICSIHEICRVLQMLNRISKKLHANHAGMQCLVAAASTRHKTGLHWLTSWTLQIQPRSMRRTCSRNTALNIFMHCLSKILHCHFGKQQCMCCLRQ